MNEALHQDRHIPLEGNYNVRDLGGYTTATGRQTKWRRFLRSDGMARLTRADQHKLLEYGVGTVVDLRLRHELRDHPNVFCDSDKVAYRHCNLLGDEDRGYQPAPPDVDHAAARAHDYFGWLKACRSNIGRIMATLAEAPDNTVLFHCAAGKDRTGVTAALLLELAGVPEQTIGNDYGISGRYLYEAYEADNPNYDSWEAYMRRVCPPAGMTVALRYAREEFGSIEEYLIDAGVTPEQITRLRSKLLD